MILGQNGRSDPSRAPPSRPGEGGGETSPSRGRKQVETGNAQDHLRPKGCVQRRGGRSRGGPGRGGTGGGVASPGISPLQLQDDVNRSVMIGASYLHDGMFSEFDRHPWDLTQGNIAENLQALRLRSEASVSRDYSTWKLKKALDKGTFLPNWPRQHIFYVFFCRLRRPAPPPGGWPLFGVSADMPPLRVGAFPAVLSALRRSKGDALEPMVAAIETWKQGSFTVNLVEEGHGAGGCIVKNHKIIETDALSSRAGLTGMRSLFHRRPGERRLQRLTQTMDRLQRKKPWKVGGRNVHYMEVQQAASSSASGASGDGGLKQAQELLKSAHAAFDGFPLHLQQEYSNKAKLHAQRKTAEIRGRVDDVSDQIVQLKARLRMESLDQPNHVSHFRFSEKEMMLVLDRKNSPEYRGQRLKDLRARSCRSPQQPNDDTREAMVELEKQLFPPVRADVPGWARLVCNNRQWFAGVAFRNVGDTDALLFIQLPAASPDTVFAQFVGWRLFEGAGEAVARDISGVWKVLGGSGRVLGGLRWPLGSAVGGPRGPSCSSGRLRALLGRLGAFGIHVGGFPGCLEALQKRLRGPIGPSGSPLGPRLGPVGALLARLGALWVPS